MPSSLADQAKSLAWGWISPVSVQIPEEANSAVPLTGVSFSVAGQHLCAMAGPTLYVLDAFEGHVRPFLVAVAAAAGLVQEASHVWASQQPWPAPVHGAALTAPVASPELHLREAPMLACSLCAWSCQGARQPAVFPPTPDLQGLGSGAVYIMQGIIRPYRVLPGPAA